MGTLFSSGEKDREWYIFGPHWVLNLWREAIMEKENTCIHLRAGTHKGWTIWSPGNQPREWWWWQGTQHKGPVLCLVLCWWGNRCCARQRRGSSLLVQMPACPLKIQLIIIIKIKESASVVCIANIHILDMCFVRKKEKEKEGTWRNLRWQLAFPMRMSVID